MEVIVVVIGAEGLDSSVSIVIEVGEAMFVVAE